MFRGLAVHPIRCPSAPNSRDAISLHLVEGLGLQPNWPQISSREWIFAENVFKIRGQGHDLTQCYNGGGMHFEGLALKLTCVLITLCSRGLRYSFAILVELKIFD